MGAPDTYECDAAKSSQCGQSTTRRCFYVSPLGHTRKEFLGQLPLMVPKPTDLVAWVGMVPGGSLDFA